MALDINALLNGMVEAAKNSFADKWPAIKDLATSSFKNLAQNLAEIEKLKISGAITPERASLMFSMQKQAAKMVLLAEEGLGLLVVEAAINAALNAIKTTVNTALGFAIL